MTLKSHLAGWIEEKWCLTFFHKAVVRERNSNRDLRTIGTQRRPGPSAIAFVAWCLALLDPAVRRKGGKRVFHSSPMPNHRGQRTVAQE